MELVKESKTNFSTGGKVNLVWQMNLGLRTD